MLVMRKRWHARPNRQAAKLHDWAGEKTRLRQRVSKCSVLHKHYLLSCKGTRPDQRITLGIQSCTFTSEFVSWRHFHFNAFDSKLALGIVIQRPTVLPPRISIPAVVNIAQETEWFICESVRMRGIVWSDSMQIIWVLHDEISIFFQSSVPSSSISVMKWPLPPLPAWPHASLP